MHKKGIPSAFQNTKDLGELFYCNKPILDPPEERIAMPLHVGLQLFIT